MTGPIALTSRPYAGAQDLERAVDLLLSGRARGGADRYPTGKRLRLLATSRLWEPARDARVWAVGESGGPPKSDATARAPGERMVGFSLLWRRRREDPTLTLEMVIGVDAATALGTPPGQTFAASAAAAELAVVTAMVAWAERRAREVAEARGRPIRLSATAFDEQATLCALLERAGFALRDEHNVYMACHLGQPQPEIEPPAGFIIRPLAGEAELAAYEALYGVRFVAMEPHHRLELLRSPEYVHLVAVAPDGTFAAFCECSVARGEWARGGRRTAWAEYVGTRPGLEGRGLGRAVIAAGLDWMQRQGAETVALITMETNLAAQRAYAAAGFQLIERDLLYTREIAPG